MFKQSSSRNSRTRGIKVKHVLQICLLVGVCFWLIYQVKHSHDKKKEFDEKGGIISAAVSKNEILKFGRKELHPRSEILTTGDEKHEEEEEEEEAGGEEDLSHDKVVLTEKEEHGEEKEEEIEEEEDESKHGEEDREEDEEEENKHIGKEREEEESKNEETEGGDDEMEEHDQEKVDPEEEDRNEDFVDEEKVREEVDGEKDNGGNESEDNEGQVENDNSTEDQDHDEGGRNTHEAREEHYKGDDASSAVAHDAQVVANVNENLVSENSSQNSETNVSEQDIRSTNSTESIGDQNNSGLKVGEGRMTENDALNVTASEENNSGVKVGEGQMTENDALNVTASEEKASNSSLYKPGESFHLNSTVSTESSDQLHLINDSTKVSTERSNNSMGESTVTELASVQNGTETPSEIKLQNATVDLPTGEGTILQTIVSEHSNNDTTSGSNQYESNSTLSSKIEKFDGSSEFVKSSNHSEFPVSENITSSNSTVEAENGSLSSRKEDMDPTENEKSDTNKESGETNESTRSSSDENNDVVQHNTLDSSDSSIVREEENNIDLDVLPEFKTEDDSNEDAAAE